MNGQYQVYKKKGALQISLIPYNSDSKRGGCVYMEAAPAREGADKSYVWDNKVKFAFGISDITTFLEKTDGEPVPFKLLHVPPGQEDQQKNKTLTFTPGQGNYAGTWMLSFIDNATGNKVTVSLNRGEFLVLHEIIRSSIPAVVGLDTSSLKSLRN